MRTEQPPLTLDYRQFIPGQPSIITLETWETRNSLANKYYPQIMDLMTFDEKHLIDILIEVEQDYKPDREFPVGFPGSSYPMAWLPKRSWLEWHLFRGVAPCARRPGISPWMRRKVIERDGLVCQICKLPVSSNDVHLDHRVPFSRGGATSVENLRVTHSVCNLRKGAKWHASTDES